MTDIANDAFHAINRAAGPMSIDYPDIAMRAAHAHDRLVECGARLFVREPWRIVRVVMPYAPLIWPVENKDATEILADCVHQINAETARGGAGHWSYSFTQHTALMQARDALLTIIDGAN